MSSGTTWARTHGRLRIDAESGEPARREAPDVDAPLVSHGGRSTIPHEQQTPADWLRHGDGSGTVWESTTIEGGDE